MADAVENIKQAFNKGVVQGDPRIAFSSQLSKLADYVPPGLSGLAQQLLQRAMNSDASHWVQDKGQQLLSKVPAAQFPK